jgi:hypothetical protein
MRSVCLGLLLLVAVGCVPPPSESDVGVVRLALVKDSYLFDPNITTLVQVYVIKAATPSGLITCSDVRGQKFNPDDPSIEQAIPEQPPTPLAGHDPNKELVIDTFQVPASQQLIFLVRGLSKYAGAAFPVAEGCEDTLVLQPGTSKILDLDIRASTGMDCGEVADCQVGLSCIRTAPAFAGGYCAKPSCTGDSDCPPGTHCIGDGSGGNICLRGCKSILDCTTLSAGQANQDCVGRVGPTAKGCGAVCVYPLWNKTTKTECTP